MFHFTRAVKVQRTTVSTFIRFSQAGPSGAYLIRTQMQPDISQIDSQELEAWNWLVGRDGMACVDRIGIQTDVLGVSKSLRKQGLDPDKVRLVMEQVALRKSANKKFSRAMKMLFQRQLLEQATDERLAAYKASRLKGKFNSLVDLCCGLGGDLIAFSAISNCTGVDASPVAVRLAKVNTEANGFSPNVAESRAEDFNLEPEALVHIDPDRRAEGRRSTWLPGFSPGIEYLDRLIKVQQHVLIKLAPVTELPEHWNQCSRIWLGGPHECKQQLVEFSEERKTGICKSAAAVDRDGNVMFEYTETEPGTRDVTERVGEFLFEPHSTVIAAKMIDSLANRLSLKRIASDVQYLTGSQCQHAALTSFRVLDVCKLNRKAITDSLQGHSIGRLEIKKRGVDHSLIEKFSNLKVAGDQAGVLVLTRVMDQYVAIVCQRVV